MSTRRQPKWSVSFPMVFCFLFCFESANKNPHPHRVLYTIKLQKTLNNNDRYNVYLHRINKTSIIYYIYSALLLFILYICFVLVCVKSFVDNVDVHINDNQTAFKSNSIKKVQYIIIKKRPCIVYIYINNCH